MNIGIDFDNTIAGYDTSFREVAMEKGMIDRKWEGKGKTELRNNLRRQSNGEKTWMELQGLVYGKYMHCAEMLPGVANFLLKCKAQNHNIFIVSHKTEFGHFDPQKISLRQEALKWMEIKRFFDQNYFGIERGNVFFANTREEKVNKISQLKCDWFIDDLPEVFEEKNFPLDTKKILFAKFDENTIDNDITPIDNWSDISDVVLGYTIDEDVIFWANHLIGQLIKKIEKISGRGNSRIYRIITDNGKLYALKHYPDRHIDARPRSKIEYNAVRLLHQHNITNVPKAVEKDEDLNIGVYEWIAGKPITDPTVDDFEQTIYFVQKLHSLSKNIDGNDINPASEACLSAKDIIGQIINRLSILETISENYPELSIFLEQTFEPLWIKVKDENYNLWPIESRENSLPREKQTLSPSDFGFHNAIRQVDDEVIFIDFDYFGWDDPVKLTADFLWHPAMKLNPELTAKWKKAMLAIFSSDPAFEPRLNAAMPLYGLRWAMIVLNEFLPKFAERRKNAREAESYDLDKSREHQLKKAKHYCEKVKAITSQVTFA